MTKPKLPQSTKMRLFRQCQKQIEVLTKRLQICDIAEFDKVKKALDEEKLIQRSFIN